MSYTIEQRSELFFLRRYESLIDYVRPYRFGPFHDVRVHGQLANGDFLYKGVRHSCGELARGDYYLLNGKTYGPFEWCSNDEGQKTGTFFAGDVARWVQFNGQRFVACDTLYTWQEGEDVHCVVRNESGWYFIEVLLAGNDKTFCYAWHHGPYSFIERGAPFNGIWVYRDNRRFVYVDNLEIEEAFLQSDYDPDEAFDIEQAYQEFMKHRQAP